MSYQGSVERTRRHELLFRMLRGESDERLNQSIKSLNKFAEDSREYDIEFREYLRMLKQVRRERKCDK